MESNLKCLVVLDLLENDFWTPTPPRPPPINFVHQDRLLISKSFNKFSIYLGLGKVNTFWAERCGYGAEHRG